MLTNNSVTTSLHIHNLKRSDFRTINSNSLVTFYLQSNLETPFLLLPPHMLRCALTHLYFSLKQAELRADAIADTLHESSKSLTRYADDEDLEAMRKSEMRPEDPMAEYIARKKQKEKGKSNGKFISTPVSF